MSELTFPYTMHCPKCKAKVKIKSPDMVGKRLPCPACKSKIDIVTPDEDGLVPYSVGGIQVEKRSSDDMTEEEMEAWEEKKRLERKAKNIANAKWTASILMYLAILGATGYGYWYFVVKDYAANMKAKEARKDTGADDFGKIFNVN